MKFREIKGLLCSKRINTNSDYTSFNGKLAVFEIEQKPQNDQNDRKSNIFIVFEDYLEIHFP